jgi:hypothetical protein
LHDCEYGKFVGLKKWRYMNPKNLRKVLSGICYRSYQVS